jgi:crotonobetainyl-CoA:carnitine CoA-transferase CaiB-like acyl-CoA transferase
MTAPGALEGIRVLDFTRHMAGPYATVTLADHGADVVKIESLPDGDHSRTGGVHSVGTESAVFLMWNRGKRSVALDLRRPECLAVVHRMVPEADVVIENYRPGVAEEIGIGYDRLAAINPRLVYCSVSAFGPSGPLASFPGTDPVIQAWSGVMSVTGEPDGGPLLVGVPVADYTGSQLAVQGVALALFARERTGRGQKVEVPMLAGLLAMLSTRLANYWASGEDPTRLGSANSIYVPYQVFETADGYAMAGSFGGDSWPKFCAALGMPELTDDERYRSNQSRFEHRDELIPLLQGRFASRTTAEWEPEFRAAGALFAPVETIAGILDHPQVAELGLVRSVDHPTVGRIPQVAPPLRLSDTPAGIGRPPPLLGEHTREVLLEFGFADDEIERLCASGAALARDATPA